MADEQVIRLPEGEPVRYDPGVTCGGKGLEMLQNMFEGLVGIDQRSGELELLQAEKMEPNADVTQFTFTLRDGLTWSDGTPITAHDYEYSWKRVLLPGDQVRIHDRDVPGRRRPGVHRGHRHDRRRRASRPSTTRRWSST